MDQIPSIPSSPNKSEAGGDRTVSFRSRSVGSRYAESCSSEFGQAGSQTTEAVRKSHSTKTHSTHHNFVPPKIQRVGRVSYFASDFLPDLDESEKERPHSRTATRLQDCVNGWPMQAFCIALALVHCLGYYLSLEERTLENVLGRLALIWGSFLPLVCINVFELLVQVAAQGGPLLHLSSWLTFYSVVFHEFEFLFNLFLTWRFCRQTYLLVQLLEMRSTDLDNAFMSDRVTVPIMLLQRLFRAYGIVYNITVQTARERRRRRRTCRAAWMPDHDARVRAHRNRMLVRLQEVVDLVIFQFAISFCIVSHCGLYISAQYLDDSNEYTSVSKFTGYVLCAILALEFFVRAGAQGGFEAFFLPWLHKLEAIFAVLGLGITAYSSYYHLEILESRSLFEPSGVVSASALVVHRVIRFFGLYMGISGSELDPDSIVESQTVKLFRQKFNDILEMPEENLLVKITSDLVTIRVRKAELRASAFEDLHLPVTLVGGMVQELFVKIKHEPVAQRRSILSKRMKPMTIVSVENLLVIFGPGKGLAEAGGIETFGDYWNHEVIREAKAKLVELIHVRLNPPSVDEDSFKRFNHNVEAPYMRKSIRETVGTNLRHTARRVMALTKEKAQRMIKQTCLRHVEVDFKRVIFQYDDLEGGLGCGPVSMGVRLGLGTVDAENGKYIQCTAMRLGFFVEHSQLHNRVGDTMVPLQSLLQRHPEDAIEEMVRADRLDIFRTWGFEELERVRPVSDRVRHMRMEAMQEKREVFSLAKVQFCCGPCQRDLLHQPTAQDAMECCGPSQNSLEEEDEDELPWKWVVHTTPVRISLDEMQARCVKTLLCSIRAWLIHDNAFKWWPCLRLQDIAAAGGDPADTQAERSSIVRLYWVYAIHRVMAMQQLRPRALWLDVLWHVRSYQKYKVLVTRIAKRSNMQLAHPMSDYAQGWERVMLEELQVQLPLADILYCRKIALLVVSQKARPSMRRILKSVSAQTLATSSSRGGFGDVRTRSFASSNRSVREGSSFRPQRATSPLPTPPERESTTPLDGTSRDPTSPSSASAATWRRLSNSSLMSKLSASSAPVTERLSDGRSETRSQKTSCTTSTSEKGRGMASMASNFSGIWEVHAPSVEVRVLRCSAGHCSGMSRMERRPLLVFAAADGLDADMIVSADMKGALLCRGTFTVDTIRARAPEAEPLTLGGTRHLCSVLKPLVLPPPKIFGMSLSSKVGEEMAFATRWQLDMSGGSACEVHMPDLRVIVYEPLLVVLLSYVKRDPPPLVNWLEPRVAKPPTTRRTKGSTSAKHSQFHKSRNTSSIRIRSTTTKSRSFEVNESELASLSKARESIHYSAAQQLNKRDLMKNTSHKDQSRFEFVAGLGRICSDSDVCLNLGAMHCTQVSEYSQTHVLIEQYKCWPFVSHAHRSVAEDEEGVDDEVEADALQRRDSTRRFSFYSEGFDEDLLVPWNDPSWGGNPTSKPVVMPDPLGNASHLVRAVPKVSMPLIPDFKLPRSKKMIVSLDRPESLRALPSKDLFQEWSSTWLMWLCTRGCSVGQAITGSRDQEQEVDQVPMPLGAPACWDPAQEEEERAACRQSSRSSCADPLGRQSPTVEMFMAMVPSAYLTDDRIVRESLEWYNSLPSSARRGHPKSFMDIEGSMNSSAAAFAL